MEDRALEAREEFKGLLEVVYGEAIDCEIYEVEQQLFRMLPKLGAEADGSIPLLGGTGKAGQTIEQADGSVIRHRRETPRKYLSIFGQVTILRLYCLVDVGKEVFPLYTWLNCPKRKYSYVLQKWMSAPPLKTWH
jgi:hypothetical protein